MKAVVLHAVNDLRYEDVPTPPLAPGHVKVRVGFCGVCGSDIPRIFQKGTYHFPAICGHEFAGTIDQVATDVTGFKPGDRVAVFPLLWCGKWLGCCAIAAARMLNVIKPRTAPGCAPSGWPGSSLPKAGCQSWTG